MLSGSIPCRSTAAALEVFVSLGDEEDPQPLPVSEAQREAVVEASLALEEVVEDEELIPEGAFPYWVSISNSRKVRRLHRTGGCYLTPGVHVRDWEYLQCLKDGCADARCRNC